MAGSFLFVPGTGAVTFRNAAGARASFVAEIAEGRFRGWTDRIVRELSCAHPTPCEAPWAPSRTSLLDGEELAPLDIIMATAYPVIDRRKYTLFPYDWRLDIRYNALELIDVITRLEPPVNILTHSQGGLVALAASLLSRDADEWHERVGRMCLVAPPLMGTVNSMDAMINGGNFGNSNSTFYRTASRTWPALFQMLPQWACVGNHPAKRSTSEGLWPGEAPEFYELLDRAKDYLAWIGYNAFRHVTPNRVSIVLGHNPAANTAIRVDALPDGPVIRSERVRGDTLVPFDATLAHLIDVGLRNRVVPVEGKHQPAHFRLLGDAGVYRLCDRMLSL